MAKRESKESKKERILQAALHLFSSQGFHATTTKEIAAACHVAEGLIFYYFGDKRALLLAIVRNFTFLMRLEGDGLSFAKLPMDEALYRYGLSYLSFLKDNIAYIRLIWSPELLQDDEVSKEVMTLIGRIGSAGGDLLDTGTVHSGQPDKDLQEIAMTMMTSTLLVHFLLQSRSGQDTAPGEEEAYIRKVVHLLLHGLLNERLT
ncbi:TetR/AcrR family transcriptional regulator [Paenibacillus sp. 1011MAR3C5]|uniref:TetR/AcrR family transcriptional regulator n=1 Tax=Paenibacillus sp. 1011MAR3C5 TaxID=1675787 RepID=UPI002175F326|nr:TetR/AcrR family transcriptional regulator [Paenibacillus sp. 1011MAR3C5]